MDIKEKAKEYANGKAMSALTAAIEKAYEDGYKDGLNHLQNEKLEAIQTGVEYKNLMLTSETQWSSTYAVNGNKRLTYLEASKLNIPSKAQFEELCGECRFSYELTKNLHGIRFTGKNGESIVIPCVDVKEYPRLKEPKTFYFWIRGDFDSDQRLCAILKVEKDKAIPEYLEVFMGLRLPIMLVKEK